ncbi:MAG: iron ABC transporter permease [Acidobacteriota bacterium]
MTRATTTLVILTSAVVVAFLGSLATGSVTVPLGEVVTVLFGGEASTPGWAVIVVQFRLPKALTAILAGAGLAVAGLLMQTLFRNPLAGPYVLGISSGASLMVALVVLGTTTWGLAGWIVGDLTLVMAACIGAAGVLGLVLLASRHVSTLSLLILGVLFGYASGALVTVLLHFSIAERIRAYLQWTFGSFGSVTLGQIWLLATVVLGALVLATLLAKPLDGLLLGEAEARALGVEVGRVKTGVLIATALLAGSITAFCGPIGFIGIAVPHLARGLLGSVRHRLLIPASAAAGALIALLADLLAQLPGHDAVLPLNAVTALLGAPVIAWIVIRGRNLGELF